MDPEMLKTATATWAESYTKLLAFNQTQYDRVLSLDSDSTVLQVRRSSTRIFFSLIRVNDRSWTSSSLCPHLL